MLNEEIKERKLAEISVKHSENRFRDIYLNSPDAIFIQSIAGIILDVNEATAKLHETGKEELIGKSIFDISPPDMHALIREIQPKIISGDIKMFESECLTASGKIIPVEISAAKIGFKGQPALLMHVRDISERKISQQLQQKLNAELEEKVNERTRELQEINIRLQNEITEKEKIRRELQGQKDFLRLIIDSTPNMIFVKDESGKFLLANESIARFFNVKPAEMEGHYDSEDKLSAQQQNIFKEQDKQALATDKEVHFPEQIVVNQETGWHVWLQMVKKQIPSVTGNEKNILGVGTDITAVKEAKESLKISEQLYREIARNLPKAAMFIFDKNLKYILAEESPGRRYKQTQK